MGEARTTLYLRGALLMGLLSGCFAGEGPCTFPAYLRVRPRWEAEVSMERQAIGAYWSFNDHSMETIDLLKAERIPTKYDCYSQEASDRYVVKSSSSDNTVAQFICFKFIQRSLYVVQIMRSKTPATSASSDLCLDANLVLDSSPILWPVPEEYTPIPQIFVGGFQFTLADHATGFNLCQTAALFPLWEADCMADDGIFIDFRHFPCRGDLGMQLMQKLYNIGSWQQDTTIYTIVTDLGELWPRLWLLRAPANPADPNSFDIDIFTSVSITDGVVNSDSSSHYTMHMKRATYTSECADEARFCTQCEANSQNVNCLKTCHSTECQKLANLAPCNFPSYAQSNWLEDSINGKRSINITSQSQILVQSQRKRSCLDLKTEYFFKGVDRRTLVTLFDNGCRPRYQCSEFHSRSASVLQLQMSDVTIWPQALPLNPGDLCAKEKFDVIKRSTVQNELHPYRWRAVIKLDSDWAPPTSVACGLSGRLYLMVHTASGQTCLGNIDTCQGDPKMFSYTADDQCNSTIAKSHSCIASFKNEENGDTFIITRSIQTITTAMPTSGENSPDYLCWVIHKSEWDPAPRLYLTYASDCHTEIANDIAYRNSTGYLAQFDMAGGPGPLGSYDCSANGDNPFGANFRVTTSVAMKSTTASVIIILMAVSTLLMSEGI